MNSSQPETVYAVGAAGYWLQHYRGLRGKPRPQRSLSIRRQLLIAWISEVAAIVSAGGDPTPSRTQ